MDEHASPGSKSKRALGFPRLATQDSERNFERFIRRIRQCNNLADARRLRSEIASQLRRDATVEGQDQMYLRRLEIGRQLLDDRIANLSATSSLNRSRSQARVQQAASSARLEKSTLTEILRDPTGLSYFTEFMDRQGMLSLVQFWLVVDGLRNPLEVDLTEEDNPTTATATWTESDLNDLSQINRVYLSKPELKIPNGVHEVVNKFLVSGMDASPGLYHEARQAILRAQSAVLEEMQKNQFLAFKKSDLYFKYLTSDEMSDTTGPSTPSPTRRATGGPQSMILHAGTQSNMKGYPLRRSATSYIGTKSSSNNLDETALLRRPLESRLSSPLFEEEFESDPLSHSVQSIDSELESSVGLDGPDYDIVQAMEEALNDIIRDGPDVLEANSGSVNSLNPGLDPFSDTGSGRSSVDIPRPENLGHKQNERPSIASLGLVKPNSRIGVFTDDDLFPDEEKFIEDEHDDPEENVDEKEEDIIEEVAPGNLWLAEAVSVLNAEIDRLTAQETVLKSLTLKAELTNNAAELRILRKSKTSLEREIRRKELQRQQYILQESDNELHGRATIRITSVMVGTEDDGHEFAICEWSYLLPFVHFRANVY